MAKQTEGKQGMTGNEAMEYVLANAGGGTTAKMQEAEEAILARFTEKEAKELVAKAAKAKADAFKAFEKEFWKPEEAGDFLQGVYLGSYPGPKYKVHLIGKSDAKGRLMKVRINGSTTLTRDMERGTPGTPVRIEYQGETKTEAGMRLKLFEVKWLEN